MTFLGLEASDLVLLASRRGIAAALFLSLAKKGPLRVRTAIPYDRPK